MDLKLLLDRAMKFLIPMNWCRITIQTYKRPSRQILQSTAVSPLIVSQNPQFCCAFWDHWNKQLETLQGCQWNPNATPEEERQKWGKFMDDRVVLGEGIQVGRKYLGRGGVRPQWQQHMLVSYSPSDLDLTPEAPQTYAGKSLRSPIGGLFGD